MTKVLIITRQDHGTSEWVTVWGRDDKECLWPSGDLLLVNGYNQLDREKMRVNDILTGFINSNDVRIAVHGDRAAVLAGLGLGNYCHDAATYSLGNDNAGQGELGKMVRTLADKVRNEASCEDEKTAVFEEIKKQSVREKIRQFLNVISPLAIHNNDEVKKAVAKRLADLPEQVMSGVREEISTTHVALANYISGKRWDDVCQSVTESPLLAMCRGYL